MGMLPVIVISTLPCPEVLDSARFWVDVTTRQSRRQSCFAIAIAYGYPAGSKNEAVIAKIMQLITGLQKESTDINLHEMFQE